MRRRFLQAAAALAVTGVCLGLLLRELDTAALRAIVDELAVAPLMLGLVVALTAPFWRGARLAALLPAERRPGGGALTRLSAEVMLWNFLLPFKLGELSFPWLLHRRVGLPLHEAVALFLLVRVTDLCVVAGVLALGAASLPVVAERDAGAALLILGTGAFLTPLALIVAAGRWHDRLVRTGGRLAKLVEGASHARGARARVRVMATTLGLWGSHVVIAMLALAASGIHAGLPATAAASAAGNLAFALPVSGVLGLGPQQVAFATTLEAADVDWTRAVAAALAVHGTVTVAAVAAGFASWLMRARCARPTPSRRDRRAYVVKGARSQR